MKKHNKIVLIFILVIALGIIGILGYSHYKNTHIYNSLAQLIADNDKIELKNVTDFEWDKFFVFAPYSQPDYINETLGFDWSRANPIGLKYDENQLLVFVKNKSVVKDLIFARVDGDFIENDKNEYTHDDAVFIKQKGQYGDSLIWQNNNETGKVTLKQFNTFYLEIPASEIVEETPDMLTVKSETYRIEIFTGERPLLQGYSSSGLDEFEWRYVPKEKITNDGKNIWFYYQQDDKVAMEKCKSLYKPY